MDAASFEPTRDQRKVIHRFTDFVLGQDYISKAARLCPISRQEKKRRRNHFDFLRSIHEPEYANVKRPVDPKTGKPIEPAHAFEITREPDSFTEEKYQLFAHYQRTVHKEPPSKISKHGFRGFLCSGMGQHILHGDPPTKAIGSFHYCYRLDGLLVAIGVLDLMPHGLSSVYLIYHESVAEWDFGKLSAMQEIALAAVGGYKYYYMGYYIDSCIKMQYKAKFHPTCVLDAESYGWDPLDGDFLARLSTRKYVSLSRDRRLGITGAKPNLDIVSANRRDHAHFSTELALGPDQCDDDLAYAEARDIDASVMTYFVFDHNVPGILSPEELVQAISMDEMHLKRRTGFTTLGGKWDLGKMYDSSDLQGTVAEFAACVGPDLARRIALA